MANKKEQTTENGPYYKPLSEEQKSQKVFELEKFVDEKLKKDLQTILDQRDKIYGTTAQ
jgi:hypothetical protein